MMKGIPPDLYWLCAGASDSESPLNAFDHALLAAGVGDTNLIRLSSILPPSCKRIDPIRLPYGGLIPVAYAEMVSSDPGTIIAAAMAVGIPEDDSLPGLMMEHHGYAPADVIETQVRQMVQTGCEHRKRALKEIVSVSVEHHVERHGAVFAGVVLWYS